MNPSLDLMPWLLITPLPELVVLWVEVPKFSAAQLKFSMVVAMKATNVDLARALIQQQLIEYLRPVDLYNTSNSLLVAALL